jgi:hypothetical protein
LTENVDPRTLDLFRFGFDEEGFENPVTTANFTDFARNLVSGNGLNEGLAVFDDLTAEILCRPGASRATVGRRATGGITASLVL